MSTEPDTITPMRATLKTAPHVQAYVITEASMRAVAAMLDLTVVHVAGTTGHRIVIPFERQHGLQAYVTVGDVLLVHDHPDDLRNIEAMPAPTFWQRYEVGDLPELDRAINAEFPDGMRPGVWVVIVETDEGVQVTFGPGIVSPAHLVGLAQIVATRRGRAA